MRITTILQYYAVLSLGMSPLSIAAAVYLYRRTTVFERLERWIDRVLPPKNPAGEPSAQCADGVPPVPAVPAAAGLPVLELEVGDRYYCALDASQRMQSYQPPVFSSTNDFVGSVSRRDGKNEFLACHCGSAAVRYRMSEEDPGNGAYEIHVLPSEEWKADLLFEMVRRHAGKLDALSSAATGKIVSEDPQGGTVTAEGADGHTRKTILKHDASGRLTQAVLLVRERSAGAVRGLLAERFEELELEPGSPAEIWVHQTVNRDEDTVDAYVITRWTSHDGLAVCYSPAWRDGCDRMEFEDNLHMAQKTLQRIIPELSPVSLSCVRRAEPEPANKPLFAAADIPEPVPAEEENDGQGLAEDGYGEEAPELDFDESVLDGFEEAGESEETEDGEPESLYVEMDEENEREFGDYNE